MRHVVFIWVRYECVVYIDEHACVCLCVVKCASKNVFADDFISPSKIKFIR